MFPFHNNNFTEFSFKSKCVYGSISKLLGKGWHGRDVSVLTCQGGGQWWGAVLRRARGWSLNVGGGTTQYSQRKQKKKKKQPAALVKMTNGRFYNWCTTIYINYKSMHVCLKMRCGLYVTACGKKTSSAPGTGYPLRRYRPVRWRHLTIDWWLVIAGAAGTRRLNWTSVS